MKLGAIGRLAALAVVLTAGLPVGFPVLPASAQMETREGIALQNQILELQREIQALQQQGGTSGYGYPPPSAYGQSGAGEAGSDIATTLLSRVETLESSVRDLRGQVQALTNQLQQQTAQLGKRLDDLQFQMQNGSAGGHAPPPAAAGSSPSGTLTPPPRAAASAPPSAAGGRRTPEMDLRDGQAALGRHDYAAAERAARAVLANKLSPHTAEAQYLLAQSLLGEKKYSQAAIAFDDSYNRSRKGPFAPESLLGLANSLTDINEKRAACDTLGKLRAEFPNQRTEVRDRAAQAARRAGCH